MQREGKGFTGCCEWEVKGEGERCLKWIFTSVFCVWFVKTLFLTYGSRIGITSFMQWCGVRQGGLGTSMYVRHISCMGVFDIIKIVDVINKVQVIKSITEVTVTSCYI